MSVRAPNGSRLSCGRNGGWRKTVEPQTKRAGRRGNAILPTKVPGSFKRMLGGGQFQDLMGSLTAVLDLKAK